MAFDKKKIEKETAQLFLDLFNPRLDSHFEVVELGEVPDVICKDSRTGSTLNLEISLLEDMSGEIAYELGHRPKPISPTTGTSIIDLLHDVMPHWQDQIHKKLLAFYGKDTALVLRQVSILWESREWNFIAPLFREKILLGKETQYGAGVWVICNDHSTWPSSYSLVCISPPYLHS